MAKHLGMKTGILFIVVVVKKVPIVMTRSVKDVELFLQKK